MRNERLSHPLAEDEAAGAADGGPGDASPCTDRLQALLDALPVGVFTVDAAGAILCLNGEAARLAGVDADSSRGRPCAEVFRCSVCGPVCLANEARRHGRYSPDLPTEVRGADGSVRSVAVAARALGDGEVAITLRDVTLAERLHRDLEARGAPPSSAREGSGPLDREAARDLDMRAALHRAAGSVTIAARLLGVHRTTLWRRMCAKGLQRWHFRPGQAPP